MQVRPLVAATLAALLLAGCIGGGDTKDSSDVIRPSDQMQQAADRGLAEGYIVDDLDVPLPDAHVTLEGTPYFDLTDSNGHYLIYNVPSGTYRLTASLANFTPASETTLEIAEGLVTHANITMVSQQEAGRRPHRHDWWGADKEVVVMDKEITFSGSPVCITSYALFGCTVPLAAGGAFTFESDPDPTKRPNLVYQGTGIVKVEATAEMTGEMDILVHTPTMAPNTYEALMRMKSGTTTVDYPITLPNSDAPNGDWDSSHSRVSFWRFRFSPVTEPAVIQAPIQLKVTVIRGDIGLPVERAHPDYWGGATNRTIMDRTCHWSYFVAVGLYETAHPECLNGPGPPPGERVLVGTGTMRVTVSWENELAVPTKFGLYYRGGDSATFTEVDTANKEGTTADGKDYRVFEFAVQPKEWDSPYAGTRQNPSKWVFNVFVTEPIPATEETGDQGTVFIGDVNFQVDIWKEGATLPAL